MTRSGPKLDTIARNPSSFGSNAHRPRTGFFPDRASIGPAAAEPQVANTNRLTAPPHREASFSYSARGRSPRRRLRICRRCRPQGSGLPHARIGLPLLGNRIPRQAERSRVSRACAWYTTHAPRTTVSLQLLRTCEAAGTNVGRRGGPLFIKIISPFSRSGHIANRDPGAAVARFPVTFLTRRHRPGRYAKGSGNRRCYAASGTTVPLLL